MTTHRREQDDYNANPGIATVYFAVLASADEARNIAVHLKWDATLQATITLEESNFPDAAIDSTTAGDWIAVSGISAAPAAAAGGSVFNILDRGSRRFRIKVVATAGGVLRARSHGKS